MMEAIVLAGGFGTRLKDAVPDLPKPMAPVAGRPFLEILLGSLATQGVDRVVLALGYMAEKVTTHFGNRFAGMELDYVIEETPLGTGGAVRLAMERCLTDHVAIFNGDTYLDLDVTALEAHWLRCRNPIIVACEVADVSRYGAMEVADGRVIGFREKGTSGPGLINAGCYVLPTGLLDEFPLGRPFSLETDFMAKEVERVHFEFFVTGGYFIDIGVPEDYARAQIELGKKHTF